MELGLSSILHDHSELWPRMLAYLDVNAGYRLCVACKRDKTYCNDAASLWKSILQVTLVDRIVKEDSSIWPLRDIESVTQDTSHEPEQQTAKAEFLQTATLSCSSRSLPHCSFVEWIYTMWEIFLPVRIRERILQEDYDCQPKIILYELQRNDTVKLFERFLQTILQRMVMRDGPWFHPVYGLQRLLYTVQQDDIFGCVSLSKEHDTLYTPSDPRTGQNLSLTLVEILTSLQACHHPAPELNIFSRDYRAREECKHAKRVEAAGSLVTERHRDSWRNMEFEIIESFQFQVGGRENEVTIDFPYSIPDAEEDFEETLLTATRAAVLKEIHLTKEDGFDTELLEETLGEQKQSVIVFDGMSTDGDDSEDATSSSPSADEQAIMEAGLDEEASVTKEEVQTTLSNLTRELETFLETQLPTTLTYESARPCVSYQRLRHNHSHFEEAARGVSEDFKSDCLFTRSTFGFLQLIMEELIFAKSWQVQLESGDCFYVVLGRYGSCFCRMRPRLFTDFADMFDDDDGDDSDYEL